MNRLLLGFAVLTLLTGCGDETTSSSSSGGGPSGYACDASTSGIDFSETGSVEGFTAAHNAIRAQYSLPDLSWDDSLAAYAHVWGTDLVEKNNCTMEHRPQDNSSPCNQVHGENLAWNSGYQETPKGVTDRWASEVSDYNYDDNSCVAGKMCGHYTQVVWRDTLRVGCAMIACPGSAEMWVCNYDPPGNWVGQKPY